jgi:hypothetical protein
LAPYPSWRATLAFEAASYINPEYGGRDVIIFYIGL